MTDFVPVGGILELGRKRYEVAYSHGCAGCSFNTEKNNHLCNLVSCDEFSRQDKATVNFIRRKDLETPKVSRKELERQRDVLLEAIKNISNIAFCAGVDEGYIALQKVKRDADAAIASVKGGAA